MRNGLVIDDSPAIHALVHAHLQKQYELTSAYDGQSGLELSRKINPEFILLDVDLPDLHGFEVCRRLKEDPATKLVPVLFLTGAASLDEKIWGLDCGANDYITKPFEPWELRARVRAAVRVKHTVDELSHDTLVDRPSGLFNQAYFERRLDSELARARRSGRSLGCLLISIDGIGDLKNNTNSPQHDTAMAAVAQALSKTCRHEDVVCRVEEGFAVLSAAVDEQATRMLAGRIQQSLSSVQVADENQTPLGVSVSIGIALSRFSRGRSIVTKAAEALRAAEGASFNKIVVAGELVELQLAA